MSNEQQYYARVDKKLEKLRAACLGQDRSLCEILPAHMQQKPAEILAEQLADQLLFALAKCVESDDNMIAQLAESSVLLRDTALHLLTMCRKEEQTFEEMRRMIFLPKGIRSVLFSGFEDPIQKESTPAILKKFDVALLQILEEKELMSDAKMTLEKVAEWLDKIHESENKQHMD